MAEPILDAERFTYRYPERLALALCDMSLELAPSSFTVVTGESGSGKSTLLRAACGLVPHFYGGEASGRLSVGGLDLRDHGPSELAMICGTLLQDPESQVVMGGVGAEISLALEHRGESPAAVARAVEEIALSLGIADLLERRTESLSGGELQRVALAAALAHRPRLVVLDEPVSQLDPVAGDELIWLLRRLNEEWGTAVLLAEHRLERCIGAADRVIALRGGRILQDARPEEFLAWAATDEPGLATPAARLFSLASLGPPPTTVKEGRTLLGESGPPAPGRAWPPSAEREPAPAGQRAHASPAGHLPDATSARPSIRRPLRRRRRGARQPAALELRRVWHELPEGPAILRGVDLRIEPGERVALMGRNGAGKSTILRHAKGLLSPTRGALRRGGDVALLLQSPGDYLLHERAGEEVGEGGLAAAGLRGREDASPRDLSGGERQRLALEVALARPGDRSPDAEGGWAIVCLDEPTRGMDPGRKRALAQRLERASATGAAVLVATHDVEFAAEFADRVVLMGKGVVIADCPVSEALAGGWHFTTQVARVLAGAGGALTPEQGARVLARGAGFRRGGSSLPGGGSGVPRAGSSVPRAGSSVPRGGSSLPRAGSSERSAAEPVDRAGSDLPGGRTEGEPIS